MNLIEAQIESGRVWLDKADMSVEAFPTDLPARIIAGISPEAIRLHDETRSDTLGMSGIARLVEHLGAETILTVALEGIGEVLVRVAGDVAVVPGDRVPLRVPHTDLHLFHPVTGEAIARRSN